MAIQAEHSDLDRAETALIGRCLASFGHLENELAALVICLHELCPDLACRSDNLSRLVKGGLGAMSGFLDKHLPENVVQNNQCATSAAANLKQLLQTSRDLRKWICHGAWSSGSPDTLTCAFWSENALKALRDDSAEIVEPEGLQFAYCDLKLISETAKSIANELKAFRLSIQVSFAAADQ